MTHVVEYGVIVACNDDDEKVFFLLSISLFFPLELSIFFFSLKLFP